MCALKFSANSKPRDSRVSVSYATQSGGTTLDRDSKGGNPFATALIELASLPDVKIADFSTRLAELTKKISEGHQNPEWVGADLAVDWRLLNGPVAPRSRRVALVLVVSDYSTAGAGILGGAAWDELRVSAMLAQNGFSVTQGVGTSRNEILDALEEFGEASRDADMAIVYSTGHGRESDGEVYLIPGDFLLGNGFGRAELARNAVPVERLTEACFARTMNLVFFAGCRTK